ncbi:MAG TPA: HAD family acid phosphatase [Longimicrobium sp.]|nr:HAD family acid phosphatase [Longimicrobium sp.]
MTARAPFLLLLSLAACQPAATANPSPAPAPPAAESAPVRRPNPPHPLPIPPDQLTRVPLQPAASLGAVHWWRNSAEHDAIYLQTDRWAGERLRELAAREPRGTWAVIMDADETVIDNSSYQLRRGGQNEGYSAESWMAWVNELAAPATPGAVDFTRLVHELGGRVAIVTNRDDPVCPQTRENLRKVGIAFDVALCRVNGQSDKNPRFQQVASGTGTSLPPLKVLMWVGDNIQDFPNLGQDVRTQGPQAFGAFGNNFVVLPNPMYGSWERNPLQ